jgi:hypothetical protein
MLRVAAVFACLVAQLDAFSAPAVRPLATPRFARPAAPVVMQVDLDELVKKLPLSDLPEPVQPWVKAYSGKPALFLGDLVGLLLAAGLNPLAAFPYILIFLAAAQPLGAYADDVTSDYGKILTTLGPAYGASTLGGLLLSAPFGFSVPGALGKLIISAICLGGPRAFQVYQARRASASTLPRIRSSPHPFPGEIVLTACCALQTTGALPEFSFDLDETLGSNAAKFEDKFGTRTDDDKFR